MSNSIISTAGNVWKDNFPFSFGDDSSWTSVWAGTAAAFLIALLWYLWIGPTVQQSKSKASCYPHPLPPRSTLGLVATLENLNSIDFHKWALELARNQAKIVELNLWPLMPTNSHFFIVSDPKVARKILENPKCLKPREGYSLIDGVVGGICFISEEGERYKHPRKSTLMGISHSNMETMLTNINAVMDQWIIDNLGQKEGDVANIDIGLEMQKATIHSIGKIAFGYDFSKEEQEQTLCNLVKVINEFGLACEKNPIRKSAIGTLFWAAKREAWRRVQDIRSLMRKVLQAHMNKSINERKEVVVLNELTTPGRYDKLGGMDALLSDMFLLFFAGFDTTGYTISFALVELAKNKDIQTQLRTELRNAANDQTRKKPVVDNVLLKNVIKETMRLWPVAAGGGVRMIPEDMVVTSDDGQGGERQMTLPKGSSAFVGTYPILRDKDTFELPDQWMPSRWEHPSEDMKIAFIPFMVGRRSCPGQLLAMVESEVFLSRLVMDYEWSLVKETQPECAITLKIKGTILQAKKVA